MKAVLHGELFLDKEGNAHFVQHTPGDMTFLEVREGIIKFIALLQSQYDRRKECPYYQK